MSRRRRTGFAVFALAALTVALLLAAFASPFASTKPDGLNKVAIDHGFQHRAGASAVAGSPLAGYGVRPVDDQRVGKGVAGVAGVAITLAIAGAVFGSLRLVARRRATTAPVGASG